MTQEKERFKRIIEALDAIYNTMEKLNKDDLICSIGVNVKLLQLLNDKLKNNENS